MPRALLFTCLVCAVVGLLVETLSEDGDIWGPVAVVWIVGTELGRTAPKDP